MFIVDKIELPKLGNTGLEAAMSEEELAIQMSAQRLAKEVLAPIAEKLDKMSSDDAVAPDSPIWEALDQVKQSGLMDLEMMSTLDNEQKSRIIPIIFEELATGDAGLTLINMVMGFPEFTARATGDEELIERFAGKRGCWLATLPDRGCDLVDFDATELAKGKKQNRPNLNARIEGDEVVINGQSSSWVSGAPIAECALAYISCDYGEGLWREDGSHNMIAVLIPFDIEGISKGKPLDKVGQRSLPQGEVFFDNVRLPIRYAVAQGQDAQNSFFGALTFANMEMAVTFTGVARAAYEHALTYVHERVQGGFPIIEHQSVQLQLFGLWQKVEACRALAKRVFDFNYSENGPHLLGSMTSKTFVTKTCFEVTSEALQLFGGNGLTREYPMEKLMRDARASLIEDGENNILSLKSASILSAEYKQRQGL